MTHEERARQFIDRVLATCRREYEKNLYAGAFEYLATDFRLLYATAAAAVDATAVPIAESMEALASVVRNIQRRAEHGILSHENQKKPAAAGGKKK